MELLKGKPVADKIKEKVSQTVEELIDSCLLYTSQIKLYDSEKSQDFFDSFVLQRNILYDKIYKLLRAVLWTFNIP